MSFDFDEWSDLYKRDPEEFERQAKITLEEAIIQMSPNEDKQQRLRAMIFNMEANLDKFVDPIARFNEVQRRFWKQVGVFKVAINSPEFLELQKKTDNVIEFQKKSY